MVLQRAGHDLAGAGALAVREHDEGVVLLGAHAYRHLRLPQLVAIADGRHDGPALHEAVGDLYGLIEQAAGVVAEVEDQAVERTPLAPKVVEGDLDLIVRRVLEVADADEADAVREELVVHASDLDVGARQRELPGRLPALADDVKVHLALGGSAQEVHGVLKGHIDRAVEVDLDDPIPGLDARICRRRIRDWIDDDEVPVLHADDDAEAAELAPRRQLHLPVLLRPHEVAVGIKRREHPVDRRVFDVVELRVVQEVGLNEPEDVAELERGLPEAVDVSKLEGLLGFVDPHEQAGRQLVVVALDLNEQLGHLLLNRLHGRPDHTSPVYARGVDVVFVDLPYRAIEDDEVREIVGRISVILALRARRSGRELELPVRIAELVRDAHVEGREQGGQRDYWPVDGHGDLNFESIVRVYDQRAVLIFRQAGDGPGRAIAP